MKKRIVPKIALTCKQGYLILTVVASNFLPQISDEGEFRISRKKIIMNTIKETSQMEVWQYQAGAFSRATREIIREIPLGIMLNGEKIAVIASSGRYANELAVGFLRSEGLITTREEIEKIDLNSADHVINIFTKNAIPIALSSHKTIASSGARCVVEDHTDVGAPMLAKDSMVLTPEIVFLLMDGLLEASSLHDSTGGTHSAALASKEGLLTIREDIGRHNAIDMLGGYALLNAVDCTDKIIVRTGRVSSEIVHKIRRLGIPLVISISVPTAMAVKLAEDEGITLVGSVRGGKFIVYTHEERLGELRILNP